jgi:hypothetical protein
MTWFKTQIQINHFMSKLLLRPSVLLFCCNLCWVSIHFNICSYSKLKNTLFQSSCSKAITIHLMAHLTDKLYIHWSHSNITGFKEHNHSKACIGKYLPDAFPIQNGLKKGDALPSLLFNFTLGYAIRNIKSKQNNNKKLVQLKLNGHNSFRSMWMIIYWG